MKKHWIVLGFIFSTILMLNARCHSSKGRPVDQPDSMASVPLQKGQKEIYFAGGCFWGTEHFFKQVRGVVKTTVGYANGKTAKPNYHQVSSGKTGFVEAVQVIYDPQILDLGVLIDLYFKTVDPTSLNQQGNDVGTQYRTGIYYVDQNDENLIKDKLSELATQFTSKIQIENLPLQNYYKAEDYHQDYLTKNPDGYCHIHPELFEYAKKANPKK